MSLSEYVPDAAARRRIATAPLHMSMKYPVREAADSVTSAIIAPARANCQFRRPATGLTGIKAPGSRSRYSAAMAIDFARAGLAAGIAALLMALLLGPLWSPAGFDWMRHTTSEQAGQRMSGARIMRTGFVAYGLSILFAAALSRGLMPAVRAALAIFGLGLVAAAVWSNAPVVPGLDGDPREDAWHSVASGVVGAGFAAACAARLFLPGGAPRDAMAWAGLAISVAVPIAMGFSDDLRGLLQRLMFLFSAAYVWREFGRPR